MTNINKTWFITGSGRGIGACLMKAVLARGFNVVATARDSRSIRLPDDGSRERVLTVDLDVTDEAQARTAVEAALGRFGRIDVLVNNAGYGQLGLFEENTSEAALRQYATNVFGLFHVTRAVLPTMRSQRSGHIFNISSIAGVRGSLGASLYCSSKFAVEGFTESIAKEVAAFGIRATVIEPGYFRTDFMDASSVRIAPTSLPDYAEQSAQLAANYAASNHTQAGDPARLAEVIVGLAAHAQPPLRFAAGSDAVEIVRTKIDAMSEELARWQSLSVTTDGSY